MTYAVIYAFAFIVGGPTGLFWTAGVLFVLDALFTWQEQAR